MSIVVVNIGFARCCVLVLNCFVFTTEIHIESFTPREKKVNGALRFTFCCGMIKSMKYPVLLHKSKYGYSVSAPSLPGCHSQGKSEREALVNIKDAIRVYLAMERRELGAMRLGEVEVALA